MLYRTRAFTKKSGGKDARRRAFDKAVRRKPLAFAADAGLCKLNAAHGTGASQVRVVSGGGEEPVANSATGKGSSMVVLGMSICVKQELVRGQGASSPRLGFISTQTSGRFFHAFLRFSSLAGDLAAVSVLMIRGTNCTLGVRCWRRPYDYIAKTDRNQKLSSVACGSHAGHNGLGGPIQAQDAGDELADGDP